MKKFSFLWFIIVFAFSNVLHAGTASGTAGYQFLRTYPGARPAAMAGAFISMPGDIHAIYYNPAGLAALSRRIVTASYLNYVLDFNSGFVAYSQKFRNLGQFAVAVNYMNYGEFDETNNQGEKQGTFNAGSFYITSSFAKNLTDRLAVGASAKFIHSNIANYSSSGLAVDGGMIYKAPFLDGMNIGLGVFNLGAAVSAFIDEKDPLPLNFVLGISKRLAHLPLEYSVSVNKYIDDDIQINVGGEFTLAEGIFLRLGYNSLGINQKIGGSGDQFAGVSLGLGMNWRDRYQFDYGFSSYGAIGYLNRLSFSYCF